MSFPGILVAGSSYDLGPASMIVAASRKVLVPGAESDDVSSSTNVSSNTETGSSSLQVI